MQAPNEEDAAALDIELDLQGSYRRTGQALAAHAIPQIDDRARFEPERVLSFGEDQSPAKCCPVD